MAQRGPRLHETPPAPPSPQRHGYVAILLPTVHAVLRAPKPGAVLPPDATLGVRLRFRRRELGHRQKDAAQAMGSDPWTLMGWEKDCHAPQPRWYPAIIEYLGYEPWKAPRTFGEALKAERRRRGLTGEEAAKVMEIDYRAYWKWETGQWRPQSRSWPRIRSFVREEDFERVARRGAGRKPRRRNRSRHSSE